MICMDESSKQHEARKLENIPAKRGQVECFDTGYERNGTSNILLSFWSFIIRRNAGAG